MAKLDDDIRSLDGIGETRAKNLNKLGVYTVEDILSFFPRAYEDRTAFKKITELTPDETACVAAIVASEPVKAHIRKGMDVVKVRVVDGEGSMNVTFFNQTYMQKNLIPGEGYIFYGKVTGTKNRPAMINPVVERERSEGRITGRIMPIYHLTAGLTQNVVTKAVENALSECVDLLEDPLPRSVQTKYGLARTKYSYETVHFPKSFEELDIARRRLIFEELFILSCALNMRHENIERSTGRSIKRADMSEFFASLPYKLTGAQMRATEEALSDMERTRPMSRLVQGDVGSGKTVVAAACCYNAARSGVQCAMMAPTEILAEQHLKTLTEMLTPLGMTVGILKGGMSASERRKTLFALKNGDIDVIVGTHALISDSVEYNSLGLVITDEQHRFGVDQRAALAGKGNAPHVLVMSATPIPRTLAMIIYGDLDISVINELPPGRQKVDTFLVGEKMRARINAFIRKQVSEGHQVYVVCPAVEESEDDTSDLKSVVEYAKTLSELFSDLRVEFIHGKMKGREKDEIMARFAAGETDILIATTVIEVGVDVPNATLIVIENAERFGLSQLHQLRGRVGRGKDKAYCVMFADTESEVSRRRLKVMCDTNDGFKIAEEDLRLRGPGDFFGSRQHGLPELKIANFVNDMELLRDAQTAAREVINADPRLINDENRKLRERIEIMLKRNAETMN